MELIVLIIHLMIAIALVGVILMQQSEGGALGLGGGGGGGMSGFLTGRAAANILTRMTTILGAGFIRHQHAARHPGRQQRPADPAAGRAATAGQQPAGNAAEGARRAQVGVPGLAI